MSLGFLISFMRITSALCAIFIITMTILIFRAAEREKLLHIPAGFIFLTILWAVAVFVAAEAKNSVYNSETVYNTYDVVEYQEPKCMFPFNHTKIEYKDGEITRTVMVRLDEKDAQKLKIKKNVTLVVEERSDGVFYNKKFSIK